MLPSHCTCLSRLGGFPHGGRQREGAVEAQKPRCPEGTEPCNGTSGREHSHRDRSDDTEQWASWGVPVKPLHGRCLIGQWVGVRAYLGCPASAGGAGFAARSCGRGAGWRRSMGSRPATAPGGVASPSGRRARSDWGCGSSSGTAHSGVGSCAPVPGWRHC